MTMTQITAVSSSPLILRQRRSEVSLPDEIILQIFLRLAPWDLEHASLVSKQWQRVSDDSILWRLFEKTIFPRFHPSHSIKTDEEWIKAEHAWASEREKELTPDQLVSLKRKIIAFCNKKLKGDSIVVPLYLKHNQFNEPALQVFYSYAMSHREKVILFPEYLMAMKGFKINYAELGVFKENIFNLFIDLNEEELLFNFFTDIDFLRCYLGNKLIVAKEIFELSAADKLKFFPVLRIFHRLLDKGAFSLIAAKLYKCNLDFELKVEVISNLLQRIDGLSWFRRSRILSMLESNLKMDNYLEPNARKQISDLIHAAKREPIVIQKMRLPSKNGSLGFYKMAHLALRFFKTGCFIVGGLATAVLLRGWIFSPYYISPLSLKVFVLAGLCFVGIKVLEKVLETSSDQDINALITQALECVDSSQDYKAWKQKMTDQGILNPFIYRACQAAQFPYRRIDSLQAEWEVYEFFYALHFAIDQFANNQETQLSAKSRINLFKLAHFLDQVRAEKLAEIFVKRDHLYENPGYFNKQKYREAVATLRTKEALQIYEIKKRARKIGLEFPEVIQIEEHKEQVEAMAAATKECSTLEEWVALLEKRHLLLPLLKLAQSNLPPSYRCVNSGKLLFAAVSQQGNFYDAEVFDELRKLQKNDLPFVREFETSWQLYSAINQVFRTHFVFFGSTNQEIYDCVDFLAERAQRKLYKISRLKIREVVENEDILDSILKEQLELDYTKCRHSSGAYIISADLWKVKQQLPTNSENQVEFAAHSNLENL